jgi:hypothetical protein
VQSAKLRLVAQSDGTSDGPAVYRTSSLWLESWIAWENRPPRFGGAVGDVGAIPPNAATEYDVTSAVSGNGLYSFNLASTTNDGVSFHSAEAVSSDRRPVLVLAVSG